MPWLEERYGLMEKGYFAAAWGDVTKSPGWISKLLRLGLLLLVPIFGQVVAYGYLYGWARDIAWNVHRPLPAKIFGNEDGNLYKRGFFIFLVALVFSLVPGAFNCLSHLVSGTALVGGSLNLTMNGSYYSYAPLMGGVFFSMVLGLFSFVLALAVAFFAWVGSMRTALYGTLSAGFQLNKIWAMLRYDFPGLLRIFAMALIVGLVIGFFLMVALFMFVLVGVVMVSAASVGGSGAFSVALFGVGVFSLFGIAFLLLSLFCIALCDALVIRALGYWTRQFEVSRWGGQEDPMPFEQRAAAQQHSQQPAAYQQDAWQPAVQQSSAEQQDAWQQPTAQQPTVQQPTTQQPTAAQQSAEQPGSSAGKWQKPERESAPSGEGGAAADAAAPFDSKPEGSQVAHAATFNPADGAPVQTAPYPVSGQDVHTAPHNSNEAPFVHEAGSSNQTDEEASSSADSAKSVDGSSEAPIDSATKGQPSNSKGEDADGSPAAGNAVK